MAELVDAADLKSADYYNLKGSSPFIPKATTHLDKSALEEKNKKEGNRSGLYQTICFASCTILH